jgi:NTE family protein
MHRSAAVSLTRSAAVRTIAALAATLATGTNARAAVSGRALALTGGGATGTAWVSGVLLGLQRAGIDPNAAEVVFGTSAGSIVGAQMRSGMPLQKLYDNQLNADASVLANWTKNYVKPATLAEVAALRPKDHVPTKAERAAVGALALATKLPDEAEWLPNFYRASGIADLVQWPAKPLDVISVDAVDGSVTIFDAAKKAPLQLAIAASAAVPGFTPPITIEGRRYTDGGVGGTNLNVVTGFATVLAVIPIPYTYTDTEIAALRAQGTRVIEIVPDDGAKAAIGPNVMDASRKGAAAEAGLRQGMAAAPSLRGIW